MSAAEVHTSMIEVEEKADPTAAAVRIGWDASVTEIPLGLGWDVEPVVLDWFGTGAADLLLTAGGGPNGRLARLYSPEPSAAGEFPRYDAGTPLPALDGLRCICPLANGSPTRFDLIALDREGLIWLPNQGKAGAPVFSVRRGLGLSSDLGAGPCRVVQIVATDWDGDGLPDLLAGIDDLTDYWPLDAEIPRPQQAGFNQKGGHPGYDRNGHWLGRAPRGRVIWLKNVGKPGAPAFELQPDIAGDAGPLEVGLHPAPLAVAWGGGRALEVLLTDALGSVRVYRNFGGQRPPVLMEPRTLQTNGSPLVLPEERTVVISADLDRDQNAELVYGTADGRVFAVHAGSTRGEARPPVALMRDAQELWLGGHAVVAAADLDDDGDLDLVVGDTTGRLHYVQDLGGRTEHRYAAPREIEAGGLPFRVDPGLDGLLDGPAAPRLGYAAPAVADWTGNGRLDLIVGGAGGEVFLLRNNGARTDPRFDSPVPLRWERGPLILPPRVRPAVVDWRGSGQLDLIALDLQGFLCVYPRKDQAEVGAPVPLVDRLGRFLRLDGHFGRAGRCALWAGPWTGSGRNDLLVGLPLGNRHVVAALMGVGVDDLRELPTVLLLENAGGGILIPRPVHREDGRPLVVGVEGCSPCGVARPEDDRLDLLVSGDDGRLEYLRRESLIW